MVNVDRTERQRFGKILVGLEDIEGNAAIEAVEVDVLEILLAPFREPRQLVQATLSALGTEAMDEALAID